MSGFTHRKERSGRRHTAKGRYPLTVSYCLVRIAAGLHGGSTIPQTADWRWMSACRRSAKSIRFGMNPEVLKCRNGWISANDARLANETAAAMERALIERTESLGEEGWQRLNSLRKRSEPTG